MIVEFSKNIETQKKLFTDLLLDTLPTEGFIRVMPLSQRLGIHHQTLRRWWKSDKFPKPQTRNGILLFSNAEVKAWMHSQPSIIS